MKKLILSLLLLAFLTTPVYAERMRKFDSIASQDARYWRKLTADTGLTGDKSGSFDLTTSGWLKAPIIYGYNSTYLRIGDAGTTSQDLNSEDDLLVTGELEVNGRTHIDNDIQLLFGAEFRNSTANDITMVRMQGSTRIPAVLLRSDFANDQFLLASNDEMAWQWIFCNEQIGGNYDHAAGNPTIYIQNKIDPDISNNYWGSLSHDDTGFVITSGANTGAGSAPATIDNYISFQPRGVEALRIDGSGNIDATDATFTTTGELVSGDMGIRDSSPKLSFSDSTDDTAYAFHLDQADSTWGYFQLWEGTDADGKSFQIGSSFRKPAFYIDTNNLFHAPYGIDADTGNITTTGTGTFGGASAGQSTIDSGLVVNSLGGAAAADDFRCETTSEVNAFVVDASADEIIANVDLVVNDITILTPSAAQAVTVATYTILANATMIVLDPNANYTLTSAPTIANGTTGQILYITAGNAEANTVTVQDQGTLASSNLQLGGATRIIAAKSVLTLLFDGVNWLEIAYQIS